MRAKWRKIIWAILAVQLLLLHVLFLEKNNWSQLVLPAWLFSAALVMLFHYLNYVRFRRSCIGQLRMISDEAVKQSLKEAARETGLRRPEKEGAERSFLYGSPAVREPFVIGFREPILILPEKEYDSRVLHFIFLHECFHIKQRDTLYKLFLLLMQSLLWFQPLMYLLKAAGYRDVEVACDEAVVEGKDMAERKAYGAALLDCMEQARAEGQAYSAYFYHGKRLMRARISAIMNEEKRWEFPAYAAIIVLFLDVVFSFYSIGRSMYDRALAEREQVQAEMYGYDENGEVRSSFYDGYALPECFSKEAVGEMIKLEPLGEDAYYQEWQRADIYEEKEYDELPFAANGPWQIRLKDADRYQDAVPLLLQRYLSYYLDQEWAGQWNPEESMYTLLEVVNSRLLAGDKKEAVFAVIFRYYIGSEEELSQFPEALKSRAQVARENGTYYAYFNWAVKISMVQDYVFELEGIAETEEVLAAYIEEGTRTGTFPENGQTGQVQSEPEMQTGPAQGESEMQTGQAQSVQELLADVPASDLVHGIDTMEGGADGGAPPEEAADDALGGGALDGGTAENAYQVDTKDGVLRVSGADGVFQEVPITLEELFCRGDEMDGKLTSLQPGSYQADEKKIVFAYGGSGTVPISVIFYEEESRSFKKSVVTEDYFGGRKIFVDFPENGQEGFLIFTGERVVWQETTLLFHTTDGGKSWQRVEGEGPDVMTMGHSLTTSAVFLNNRVGFVTIRDSEKPEIWRTENGGKTWRKQELPDVPEYYCMAYAPEEKDGKLYLYVGMEEYSEYGGTKARYESDDEGKTWEYRGIVVRK